MGERSRSADRRLFDPTAGGVDSLRLAKWRRPLVCDPSEDPQPPLVSFVQPLDGDTVTVDRPALDLSLVGVTSPIDTSPGSLVLQRDGDPLPATCTYNLPGASCVPDSPLTDGPHTLSATG